MIQQNVRRRILSCFHYFINEIWSRIVSLGIDESRDERQTQIENHPLVEFNIPAVLAQNSLPLWRFANTIQPLVREMPGVMQEGLR
jgi:hypothetical protein